jgi:ComF family protein
MNIIKRLYQPHCALCRLYPATREHALCTDCWADLPWRRISLRQQDMSISIVWDYTWPIDRLIQQFKYQQRTDILPILRCAMTHPAPTHLDALVPIPMSKQRLQARGMNHAHLLAKALSRQWQIPIWAGLSRPQDTTRQQTLDRHARLHNLQHAFASQSPTPKRLLLIDDVLTTGATLQTARQCLIRAGAQQVDAWVLASSHQT